MYVCNLWDSHKKITRGQAGEIEKKIIQTQIYIWHLFPNNYHSFLFLETSWIGFSLYNAGTEYSSLTYHSSSCLMSKKKTNTLLWTETLKIECTLAHMNILNQFFFKRLNIKSPTFSTFKCLIPNMCKFGFVKVIWQWTFTILWSK